MLSIIIPTYNEEKYLPRLLKCIERQTYKDYEIIVADANSLDKTKDVAKKHRCRIVKGGLPAKGRNNGARSAKGDFLLFMDADAQFDSEFIKKSLSEIKKRNLDCAGCTIKPIGSHPVDITFFSIFNSWIILTQCIYPNASGCGIFCKKSIHHKIDGFDEEIKLSEDMDYVRRAGRIGKFRILKSISVDISMRRFEKEGRFNVGFKLLFSAIYRLLFGEIKSNVFKYNLRYRR